MKILGRMAVFPEIPERITRLHELAYNLWWTWNPAAQRLYATISPDLWQTSEHNAVRVLLEVDPARLAALADRCATSWRATTPSAPTSTPTCIRATTWFSQTYPERGRQHHRLLLRRVRPARIAAHLLRRPGHPLRRPLQRGQRPGPAVRRRGLPLSAGLLPPAHHRDGPAGGHLREAALLAGPGQPALDPEGHEVMISVELPGRTVYAKVWRIQVGRIPLYLMDTDVEPNDPRRPRTLGAALRRRPRDAHRPGDHAGHRRRARAAGAGHRPDGLAHERGPLGLPRLERCRELVAGAGRIDFEVAREIAAANAVFTTHTPVAAGNDVFNFELMDTLLRRLLAATAARPRRSSTISPAKKTAGAMAFSMTVLALRLSTQHNGVSKLHGEVSRADVAVPLARARGRRGADQLHHQRRAYRHLARPATGRSLSALPGRRLVRPPRRSGALGARARDPRRRAVGGAQPAQRAI